jgi:hypothetical protein
MNRSGGMTDLSKIPTEELVTDYYRSKLDERACRKLAVSASSEKREYMTERAETNRRILVIIKRELERRGEGNRVKGD